MEGSVCPQTLLQKEDTTRLSLHLPHLHCKSPVEWLHIPWSTSTALESHYSSVFKPASSIFLLCEHHSVALNTTLFPSFGSIGTAITDICIVRVFSTLLLQYEMTFMHLHFVPHRRKEVRHTSTRRHHPLLSRGAPVVLMLIILIERIAYRHRNKNKEHYYEWYEWCEDVI